MTTKPTPSNPAVSLTERAVRVAANRLRRATTTKTPCRPIRDVLGDSDLATAYAVQDLLVEERLGQGAVLSGRKIGLTAPAVQQQLGVDQPDFGVLFADMDVSACDRVPYHQLLQPKIEAEVAFGLTADLDREHLNMVTVRAAVGWAAAALEIVDSRVADWDIAITDTIADNASSGLYVLSPQRVPLSECEPRAVEMELFVNGTKVSTGNGAACLGDPLAALVWLARAAHSYGRPLQAGQVVLSGALGPMAPVPPGAAVYAEITSLGRVAARFSDQEHV